MRSSQLLDEFTCFRNDVTVSSTRYIVGQEFKVTLIRIRAWNRIKIRLSLGLGIFKVRCR